MALDPCSREADEARERGRLMTAQGMASDPEGRKRVEDAVGVAYCRARYPEAYREGFSRMLDRVRQAIPW